MPEPTPNIAEKLAKLCWPNRMPNFVQIVGFDPTTDANDWERVLNVLIEKGLVELYCTKLEVCAEENGNVPDIQPYDMLAWEAWKISRPLPERCAAAIRALEE